MRVILQRDSCPSGKRFIALWGLVGPVGLVPVVSWQRGSKCLGGWLSEYLGVFRKEYFRPVIE